MEVSARPNNFLQKLPFRRKHHRHPRPYEDISAGDLPSVDRTITAYHLRSSNSSETNVPDGHDEKLSGGAESFSKESLADPRLSPRSAVPPYTPMPIPNRVSSANVRQPEQTAQPNGHNTRLPNGHSRGHGHNPEGEPDDLSLNFSGFDEDLLQPRSSVSPVQSASPPRGRSRRSSPRRRPADGRSNGARSNADVSSIEMHFPMPPGGGRRQLVSTVGPVTLGDDALVQLQTPCPDQSDIQNSELNIEDNADSWDVIRPAERPSGKLYSLEKRAEQLYSPEHLRIILDDPKLLFKFSAILRKYRPWRVGVLSHYLAACKAKRALEYTNSLTRLLASMPYESSLAPPGVASNPQLEAVAKDSFDALLSDDLHYYITHTWIKVVSAIVQRRITGTLPPNLLETSNGLAEVFCITDPSRQDNPIILASEAFTRHSGCSLEYVLGRNCRFMQGPGTTVDSCRRFAISCQEAKDHTEIFVNYRRDGSPFLSMVLNAPLCDSRGNVRYFLGAQVDVSGLLRGCNGMESLMRLVDDEDAESADEKTVKEPRTKDHRSEFKALSDMFTAAELDTIRRTGGSLQTGLDYISDPTSNKATSSSNRVILGDGAENSDDSEPQEPANQNGATPSVSSITGSKNGGGIPGNLPGVYKYYLLIRPHPSLRILFASPAMRSPGLLQTPFLDHVGGSTRMRQDLEKALRHNRAVTAKVRWLVTPNQNGEGEGRVRYLHATPLMHAGPSGVATGLWMIVLVQPNSNDDVMSIHSNGGKRTGSRMGSNVPLPGTQ